MRCSFGICWSDNQRGKVFWVRESGILMLEQRFFFVSKIFGALMICQNRGIRVHEQMAYF